jgi:hypothetical protein
MLFPLLEVQNMQLAMICTGNLYIYVSFLSYYDTFFNSAYDYEVPAMGKVIAKTDIQIQLPEGCYGRVAPRSGLAANHHIDIGGCDQVETSFTFS